MADKVTISGELNRIVFQGEDNNFVIAAFRDIETKSPFTALGTILNPQIDMDYSLTGKWEHNSTYGPQFRIDRFESLIPKDPNGIFKYIVRVCKFVGATVGNQIIEKYGEETLNVMKNDPQRLCDDISGITFSRAKQIQDTLIKNEIDEAVSIELEGILDVPGMRKSLLGDLIARYKSNAAEIVKGNPYVLTEFNGIGFLMADHVALNIGFPRDSLARKRAAAEYCLQENMINGNIWIPRSELLDNIKDLIQIKELWFGVDMLIKEGSIVQDKDGWIAFKRADAEESTIAKIINQLISY